MKVRNVIISQQFEENENLKEFLQVIKEKNINLKIANSGDKINIEKDVFFYVLWPDKDERSLKNSTNNNALVCKLIYKNFSMLFTGDIEKETENKLIKLYKDNLKSTVLKVAHHGSKTSSSKDFLKLVKPKIALIGVGASNTFGHPAIVTLQSLKNIGCEIYRTDEQGEVTLIINQKGKIRTNKMLSE